MKQEKSPMLRGLIAGLCLIGLAAAGLFFTHGGGDTLPLRAEKTPEEGAEMSEVVPDNNDLPPEAEMEISGDEKKEMPPGPYVAIVIDDFGFSRAIADGYEKVSLPLTWAVIPFQAHSSYAAERAEAAGISYMIHMPMAAESDGKWDQKAGVIDTGMTADAVSDLIQNALKSLPGALGMNNHRGSRATGDAELMDAVMTELTSTSLFFLDSRTSSKSVAYRTAREKGIPAAFCSIFLDHEPSEEFMERQYERGISLAAKRGWVVMIAHARTGTLEYLSKFSERDDLGATFVTMPELMDILWSGSPLAARGD